MATTGFVVGPYAGTGSTMWEPNPSKRLWYADGLWWLVAQDNSALDWFIWKKDGATPGTAGATGGWTKTSVNPDDKDSSRITTYYSPTEAVLALVKSHSTNDKLQFYTYNGTSTEFEQAGSDIDTGYGADHNHSIVVANDGRAHAFFLTGSGLVVKSTNTARTSLGAETVIRSTGTQECSACVFTDGTDWYVGVLFGDSTDNDFRFSYCKDGDDPATPGNWSHEACAMVLSSGVDNHLNVVAYVASGDSASTLVACGKDGADNIRAARVKKTTASTAWSSAVTVATGKSKCQLAIDETNDVVYCVFVNNGSSSLATAAEYATSGTGTLSFGTVVTLTEDDGVNVFRAVTTPSTVMDSTTDAMFCAINTGASENWYNLLDIAGVAAQGTIRTQMRVGF